MSKPQDKNERIIRELLKLPENMKCMDCPTKGPVYACLDLATFVARAYWLAKWTPQEYPEPEEGNSQAIRKFIEMKYSRKQWIDHNPARVEPLSNILGDIPPIRVDNNSRFDDEDLVATSPVVPLSLYPHAVSKSSDKLSIKEHLKKCGLVLRNSHDQTLLHLASIHGNKEMKLNQWI
eukprot:gene15925-18931_t